MEALGLLCYPSAMRSQDMAVVGLTGGIGAGKSSVAQWMIEAAVPVIDADVVAREIVEPGSSVLQSIASTFGERLVLEDGSLDREALGALVFSDPRKLRVLNALTHPAILARTGDAMVKLMAAGHPWVVYEAALILENRLAPGLRALVAVIAEPQIQLRRIMERDGLDSQSAAARIRAQTDNDARREAADYILVNEGSLSELEAQTRGLIRTLSEAYGPPLGAVAR